MTWSPSTQALVQRTKGWGKWSHSFTAAAQHVDPLHSALAGLNLEKIVRCLKTNWNMDKLDYEWIFSQGLHPFKLGITCFLWCHLLASFKSFYHILVYFSCGIDRHGCALLHMQGSEGNSNESVLSLSLMGLRVELRFSALAADDYPVCPLARLPSASYMKASQT